ncbi:hypothetical protein HPB47_022802 [Ixodes persulcatus]|uniref:Uncharacterized protein n=1 Tax=Ixodes persulcatus TaxID=34615 RepID=A0AC60Q9F9_IXOPE|nr:hypothetical protein HPB47_022802 [Ixodes persulcatus]
MAAARGGGDFDFPPLEKIRVEAVSNVPEANAENVRPGREMVHLVKKVPPRAADDSDEEGSDSSSPNEMWDTGRMDLGQASGGSELDSVVQDSRIRRDPSVTVDQESAERNMPKTNCPERIVICIDISSEMEDLPFTFSDGSKHSPLFMVKRVVELFVHNKHKIDKRHEFALVVFHEVPLWIKNFTSDPKDISNFLDDLNETRLCESCAGVFRLSSTIWFLLSAFANLLHIVCLDRMWIASSILCGNRPSISISPSPKPKMAKKRQALSLETKQSIIKDVESGMKISSVAAKYNVADTMVSTVWKNREQVRKQLQQDSASLSRKRIRTSKYEDVDKALFRWFHEVRAKNVPRKLSPLGICSSTKASTPSKNGSNGISCKVISGESGEVDDASIQKTAPRPYSGQLQRSQLSAVSLKFLPANTTAKSQPLDQGVIATVNALYKKRTCKRVVLKLQRDEPLKVDLRGAIDMITASWWQVKATTIQKCFRNAGFVRDVGNSEDADVRSDAIDEAIRANDVWSDLVENHFVPANDTFQNYVDEDDDGSVIREEATTDEAIVAAVRGSRASPPEDEPDDDEESTLEVSRKDALEFLQKLKVHCEQWTFSDEVFKCLSVFKDQVVRNAVKRLRQAKVTHFFQNV